MSSEILDYCDEILEFAMRDSMMVLSRTDRDEYVNKCNTKYEDFFTKYPTLFYKIIDDPVSFKNHGRKRLLKMLNTKNDIDTNKTTHEEASKKIGKSYYNEYVKPVIKEEPNRTSENVKNEISQLIDSLSEVKINEKK